MLESWCLRRQRIICSTDNVGVQAEDGSDEYGGSKPFSEPESRIVRLLAENTRPQVSPPPSHALRARQCRRAQPNQCVTAPEAD